MVIDVAPDRKHRQVRGRSMMQAGLHETAQGQQRAWWEGGIYENDYVRENGVLEDQGAALFSVLAWQLRRRLAEDADRLHPDGQDAVSRKIRWVPMR